MRCTEGWKFIAKWKDVMRVINCCSVFFFETLNVWNCSLNKIVEGKYEWNLLLVTDKWVPVESPIQSPI
jgi:hypothetical protein